MIPHLQLLEPHSEYCLTRLLPTDSPDLVRILNNPAVANWLYAPPFPCQSRLCIKRSSLRVNTDTEADARWWIDRKFDESRDAPFRGADV